MTTANALRREPTPTEAASINHICDRYNIRVHLGQRVVYDEYPGSIVGFVSSYLLVELDCLPEHTFKCHPTYRMTYFGDHR